MLHFVLYGIFAGFIFLFCLFLRRLVNYNFILTFILDTIFGVCSTLLFGICLIKFQSGNFKLVQVFLFIIGILITIISLEKIVASIGNFVYNKLIITIKNRLKLIFIKGKNLWKRKNLQK